MWAMQVDRVPAHWDRRLWPAVLLFVLTLPIPVRVSAQETSAPEVRAVLFPGAVSLPRSELTKAIATKATRCRSPLFQLPCMVRASFSLERRLLPDSAELARDDDRLELLYEAWGHPGTVVEHRVVPRGSAVTVEFTVRETPSLIVESVAVRGIDTIRPAISLGVLPLAAGQPYALPRIEATEERLQDLLAEHGRPFATVTFGGSVDESRRRAQVTIDVTPGQVAVHGAPRIRAAPPLNDAVVRARLGFSPGTRFQTSALEQTERALYGLPIVARAVAAAVAVPGDSVITADIMVETRRRRGLEAEGTVSSTDCLEIGGFWRDRYFLGGPRVLALGASFSNLLAAEMAGNFPCTSAGTGDYGKPNYRFQAEVWEAGLGDAHNTLRLAGFARRESAPSVYVQEGFGGEVAVARDLGRGAHVQLSIAPERQKLTAVSLYYCGNYGVCAAEDIARFRASSWLTPVQLIGAYRTPSVELVTRPPGGALDFTAPHVPAWKHNLRVGVESSGAWSGSDYTFLRGVGEAITTRTFGRTFEIAARMRGATLTGDDVLPPQLRLFSGGVNTVRGTEQNLVGPLALVVADDAQTTCAPSCDLGVLDPNLITVRPTGGDGVFESNIEARLWLSNRLQAAAFVDYGRVFASGGRSEGLLAPGIGLRVMTDLGPIRLDIGYDGRGARTYPVFVEASNGDVVRVGNGRFDPFSWDNASGLRSFVRRLQLHMAIGQPF
jgi:outer membrane protein assembly factor BamA